MDKMSDEQLDQLLSGIHTLGQVDALYTKLLQRVINRSLDAEMDVHLGYSANENSSSGRRSNSRNGKTSKSVKDTFGEVEIETPRDRDAPHLRRNDAFQPTESRGKKAEQICEKHIHAATRSFTA